QTVSSRDTNHVIVQPISVACTLLVSTNNGITFVSSFAPPNCLLPGTPYIVRVVVTNTGSYPLQNVTVSNVVGLEACIGARRVISFLDTNASASFDCSNFVCNANGTNHYAVTVTAEASQSLRHVCDYNIAGQHIVAQSACDTTVCCTCTPCIRVFKGVACVVCTTNDGGGVRLACASATGGFEPEAFGVRSDTQDPAFCYQIMVTNCGSCDLNVLLTDEILGLINVPIGILAPHGTF